MVSGIFIRSLAVVAVAKSPRSSFSTVVVAFLVRQIDRDDTIGDWGKSVT